MAIGKVTVVMVMMIMIVVVVVVPGVLTLHSLDSGGQLVEVLRYALHLSELRGNRVIRFRSAPLSREPLLPLVVVIPFPSPYGSRAGRCGGARVGRGRGGLWVRSGCVVGLAVRPMPIVGRAACSCGSGGGGRPRCRRQGDEVFVEAAEVVDTFLKSDDDPHEVRAVVMGVVRRNVESPLREIVVRYPYGSTCTEGPGGRELRAVHGWVFDKDGEVMVVLVRWNDHGSGGGVVMGDVCGGPSRPGNLVDATRPYAAHGPDCVTLARGVPLG